MGIHKVNNFTQHFENQKNFINQLFSDDSQFSKLLHRHPKHPAVVKYKICKEIIDQNGIVKWPENQDIMPKFASVLFNSYILTKISGGNLTNFSLGNFANYGDEKVIKKIKSQIHEPDKYQDLMTEFSFGAWFLDKAQYRLIATEDEGLADFKISITNNPIPLIVDCKYINTNTKDTRYKQVIDKGNQQIKKWRDKLNVQQVYGMVVIDVSSKLVPHGIYLEQNLNAQLSKLQPIVDLVRQSIKNHFSSVSGVLLIWDVYGIERISNDQSIVESIFAKNGVLIRHSEPIIPLPDNLFIPPEWGYQTGYKINFSNRNN